jgi:hypothetical protein
LADVTPPGREAGCAAEAAACDGQRSGRAEPSTMPVENSVSVSGAGKDAAPVSGPLGSTKPSKNGAPFSESVPLGSETACIVCGTRIIRTRLSRRFCSKFCNDLAHGRRKARGSA